ncbi:hypothetical protein PCANC_26436 [Puccinia coronata f. sp. avenae]|uniref:Uncharacterized protein n=1 Tax=Puccinia coronata f. sp. avenae TaxID=200324 RepID=A0A2N5TFE0_9BASI|nr:hypothetical protein PCANC_26436 [Puccinia coronata f. sp. avenae]
MRLKHARVSYYLVLLLRFHGLLREQINFIQVVTGPPTPAPTLLITSRTPSKMTCRASKNVNHFRNCLAIDFRHSGSTKKTTLACFIFLIVQIAGMPAMEGATSIRATLAQTGRISNKSSKATILEEGTSQVHWITSPRVDPVEATGHMAFPLTSNRKVAHQYAGKSQDTATSHRITYLDPDFIEAGPRTIPTTSNHKSQVTAHEESRKQDKASLKKNQENLKMIKESLKLSSEPDALKRTPEPVAHQENPGLDAERNSAPEVKAARKGFKKRLRNGTEIWHAGIFPRKIRPFGAVPSQNCLLARPDSEDALECVPRMLIRNQEPEGFKSGYGHVQTPPHESHHGQVQEKHVSPATPPHSHDESEETHQHSTPLQTEDQLDYSPHNIDWYYAPIAHDYPPPKPIEAYPASLGRVNGLTPTSHRR